MTAFETLYKINKEDPKWRFISKNQSGNVYVYQEEPQLGRCIWIAKDIPKRIVHDVKFPSDDWSKCKVALTDIESISNFIDKMEEEHKGTADIPLSVFILNHLNTL